MYVLGIVWQEHMTSKVNLVWATPNGEQLMAYMARVSNPSNQDNEATAGKLIKYLTSNKHWSPLDMVDMCVEIETTRDIARQILRHRSFFFQEFSQRYADPRQLSYSLSEMRLQDTKNRQNSIVPEPTIANAMVQDEWTKRQMRVVDVAPYPGNDWGDAYTIVRVVNANSQFFGAVTAIA